MKNFENLTSKNFDSKKGANIMNNIESTNTTEYGTVNVAPKRKTEYIFGKVSSLEEFNGPNKKFMIIELSVLDSDSEETNKFVKVICFNENIYSHLIEDMLVRVHAHESSYTKKYFKKTITFNELIAYSIDFIAFPKTKNEIEIE